MGTRASRKTTPTAAEQKRRAAQAAKAKAAADSEPPESEEGEPEGVPLEDGVFVARIPVGDGVNYRFAVVPLGDVRPTEIGDILAYGLRDHRSRTDPQ